MKIIVTFFLKNKLANKFLAGLFVKIDKKYNLATILYVRHHKLKVQFSQGGISGSFILKIIIKQYKIR
jgi:hypothetical protein